MRVKELTGTVLYLALALSLGTMLFFQGQLHDDAQPAIAATQQEAETVPSVTEGNDQVNKQANDQLASSKSPLLR